MSLYTLGVDPDLHDLALALVEDEGPVLAVKLVRVPRSLAGEDAVTAMIKAMPKAIFDFLLDLTPPVDRVVVEAQHFHFKHSPVKPIDIIRLAAVGGAAAALAHACAKNDSRLFRPTPSEWKGTIKKGVHQARVLEKLGIPYDVVSPEKGCRPLPGSMAGVKGASEIPASAWIHIVDAIGLAVWGAQQR